MDELRELISTLENILDDMTEEGLAEYGPELINQLSAYLTGEEALASIALMVNQADLMDYKPGQLNDELNNLRDMMTGMLSELRENYTESPIKLATIDRFEELMLGYVNAATLYLMNRGTAAVGVEFIHPNAKLPTYAHEGDQGADIYAVEDITIMPHTYGNMVPTGLKLLIPYGWAISIRPRSGLSKNTPLRISNSPATIDQQYRGEVKVLFDNFSDEPVQILAGDRIAQFILEKNHQAAWQKIDTVEPSTDRGEGGFGSSGL